MSSNNIQYWINIAEYDLQVAASMLEKKHYLYVGFMCHQAIEKLLKAYYVKNKKEIPPYIHNLDKLIDKSGIRNLINKEFEDFIDELIPLNIQARYPSYIEEIHKLITKDKAEYLLKKTKEIFKWLKETM